MEKNERYIAAAAGYSEDGAGVTRINGIVIFVPGLLNGEEAEIGITKMKKNYGYGRIIKILKPSLHRIDPICSVYKQCGGCQLQHMDSNEQNTFKENKVKDCFHKIAGMDVEIQPIIKVEPHWNYRIKYRFQYNAMITRWKWASMRHTPIVLCNIMCVMYKQTYPMNLQITSVKNEKS